MRRPVEPVYRAIVGLLLFVFGPVLRLEVQGRGSDHVPADGGAVLAITHFGYLDFALTGKVVWQRRRRLVRFLATQASFDHWASGPLMRAMRHVPVDRARGAGSFDEAVRRLGAGELVGVFPESQVNRSWVVGPCKTGAVRMAADAGVPLLPVAVWGGHRVMTRGRRIGWRERRRVVVRVEIGEPFVGDGDVAARTEQLRARMQELVAAAQRSYPQTPRDGDDWWLPASLGGSAPTPEQAAALDAVDEEKRQLRKASAAS